MLLQFFVIVIVFFKLSFSARIEKKLLKQIINEEDALESRLKGTAVYDRESDTFQVLLTQLFGTGSPIQLQGQYSPSIGIFQGIWYEKSDETKAVHATRKRKREEGHETQGQHSSFRWIQEKNGWQWDNNEKQLTMEQKTTEWETMPQTIVFNKGFYLDTVDDHTIKTEHTIYVLTFKVTSNPKHYIVSGMGMPLLYGHGVESEKVMKKIGGPRLRKILRTLKSKTNLRKGSIRKLQYPTGQTNTKSHVSEKMKIDNTLPDTSDATGADLDATGADLDAMSADLDGVNVDESILAWNLNKVRDGESMVYRCAGTSKHHHERCKKKPMFNKETGEYLCCSLHQHQTSKLSIQRTTLKKSVVQCGERLDDRGDGKLDDRGDGKCIVS
eukprot:g380.t1